MWDLTSHKQSLISLIGDPNKSQIINVVVSWGDPNKSKTISDISHVGPNKSKIITVVSHGGP